MENINTLLAAVAQTQGFEEAEESNVPAATETGLENSGSPAAVKDGSVDAHQLAVVDVLPPASTPAFSALGPVIGSGEKRKRGRPYGQIAAKSPPLKRNKPVDEDEDVCFICFDGGSLVLCDRKGCPKAYHPACIKRDEAFFQSKSKWYCGWHICSVCRKASHYLCYTCTYSLCKGCIKDADYSCVRRNKGFCSTCMKTIMLIENKDQANNESVKVDFDDQTSWEYLFKVYWVILKEKLSLRLDELTQAQNPWKAVATVGYKPLLCNAVPSAVSVEVPVSYNSTEHLELNKPHVDISLPQSETPPPSAGINVDKLNNDMGDEITVEAGNGKVTVEMGIDKVTAVTSTNKVTDVPGVKEEASHEPGIEKSRDEVSIVQDAENKCICKHTNNKESSNPGFDSSNEWATKDLLEFVAHTKNGDTSSISQFDVQTLLLDYIKRNNLRDPRRKSQIICDQRLRNLFGKPRVGHIEMLKLLEFHFLVKEDSKKNSFIPAGLVSSAASEMEVDGNTNGLPVPIKTRKRKTRKKSDDTAQPQNNLNEYAAVDVHNISLIYLRRDLMENLIDDREKFTDNAIGAVVRIRISSNDQKQDVHRLVQVVGTTKVGEPYKVGNRSADVMLEVLNLDKKEVVSIDAISNQEFTEDECQRLRQSIRCGLVKQFTVGEVQNKAMALQPVRVNDWLEAQISRLNHLRDRASENGRKKELRGYVEKLQLLKSPEERSRRISETPEIHADPKMSPYYESEEDTKIDKNSKKDKHLRLSHTNFPQIGRKLITPNKKVKEERTIQAQNRLREKTDASGSSSLDKQTNQVNITNSVISGRNDQSMQLSCSEGCPKERSNLETSTASVGNSPSSSCVIDTEKLWHYRDPNGKIQGPFSMTQLRKWSTTGLFPPDMRIWTNHEQYDSLLLTVALNGKFNLASELSSSRPREEETRLISEVTNVGSRDSKQTEPALGSNVSVSSDSKQTEPALGSNVSVSSDNIDTKLVKADESGSWPQCWDLLKDNSNSDVHDVEAHNFLKDNINSDFNDVEARGLLPSSSPEKTDATLPDPPGPEKSKDLHHHESQNEEKSSSGLIAEKPITNNEDCIGVPSEENSKSLNIDLSSNDMECGSVYAPDLDKQIGNISVLDFPSPTSKPAKIAQSEVPMQNFEILELLSPTPRSNCEDQATETKQTGFINFPVPNSGQIWSSASSLGLSEVQLPEVDAEWCGYSPTPTKPPEFMSDNVVATTSTSNEPNWLMTINGTIELDAFDEESVSDLLAEVDAMESLGALPSPTSAMKFARELMEDCKDDCFSSIEEFSRKSDAFSSTGEIQLNSESSVPCKPIGASSMNTFDFLTRSSVHSSASSEGETNAPVYSGDTGSEFHPSVPNMTQDIMVGANVGHGMGSDNVDHGWGSVQGNINMVTVQGNVNLVLGGPAGQGMANLGWGTNQGTGWANPNLNPSPRNGSLPWDGQRKYGGERFSSPRERGGYQGSDSGFGRGPRPPWGRQPPYGGGGYSRPVPKGQRLCKFYESGHCKKGAFCDYLHP